MVKQMVNIKDVAVHAGVSVGTVSRYLNGITIKEENSRKIEKAISALDFRVNNVARCLRTSKTHLVGVVIPDLYNDFWAGIVNGLEAELAMRGYNIIVSSYKSGSGYREIIHKLIQRQVDGVITYPSARDLSLLKEVQEKGKPVVVVDSGVKELLCDQVLVDNIGATYNAVSYLINNNHKRIAVISGPQRHFTARERLKGYERAFEDFLIEIKGEYVKETDFTEEASYQAVCELLSLPEPPTAVIACNYTITLGVLKALYDKNIGIPDELSVIGFDGFKLSEVSRPSLSVVLQPVEAMGKKAAELIVDRIDGNYGSFPAIVRMNTELVIKKSTAAFPG